VPSTSRPATRAPDAVSELARVSSAARAARPLPLLLVLLAAVMTSASVLGPLVLGAMTYRTSPTTLNQLRGSDAAALLVVAPVSVVAAWLTARRRLAGPLLASGVGVFGMYTYAQVVIGQEYLREPGNVERFFPLLLAAFVLAGAVVVTAWRTVPAELPPLGRRLRRGTGVLLLAVAAFLVLGLHLPTMVTAWTDPASMTEYASSPTPFWMVKLMDLGIVVPSAVAIGVGLLRGTPWAARLAYPLLTGYTLLSWSVTAMAVVMLVENDPDAAPGLAAGFAVFAVGLTAVSAALCRVASPPTGRPRVDGSPA
jgi:hypothetical protein